MKAKKESQQKVKSFIRPDQPNSDSLVKGFRDEEILEILDKAWEGIAKYSYQQFKLDGRGVVVIDRNPESDNHKIFYVTFNMNQNLDIDKKIVNLVKSYDPNTEIVFQYQCVDNNARTMRVRATEGARTPAQIWWLEHLLDTEE